MRFLLLGLLCALGTRGATLIHDYDLTNSLNDKVGSLALVGDGGTIGPSGYSFAVNQGLHVKSPFLNILDYSLLIDFSLSNLIGYRKILDYSDRQAQSGLYAAGVGLDFFPVHMTGGYQTDTPVRLVVTRDGASNTVVLYEMGNQLLTFLDSGPVVIATFSPPNKDILRFFEADVISPTLASAGAASHISIYDGVLTPSQVRAFGGPGGPVSPDAIPEPSNFLLMASALAAFGLTLRRR